MDASAADRADGPDAAEALAAARGIAADLGLSPSSGALSIGGTEPVLPVRYPLGIAAAGVFGACGLVLAELLVRRGGPPQSVRIDLEHAALGLVSFRQLRLDDRPIASPGDANPLVGLYRCRDGRWIAIHGGFPSLREPTLALLGARDDRGSITAAIGARDSAELEDAFAAARMCGVVVRDAGEWRASAPGQALLAEPLVDLVRIGDAPPKPLPAATRPLAGVRVLDFTRILAGPTCGRLLAAAGADVLGAVNARLPNVDAYRLETGHGKRTTPVDLDTAQGRAIATRLAAGCDLFVDSYRHGALARRGLGADALARLRPGVIHVAIDCYGHSGPWCERPGWELMGQAATGLCVGHGGPDAPLPLWSYPCDYLTGYLGALGATMALMRRATEGGSWSVRVSLCRTGMYTGDFGVRWSQPPPARDAAARWCVSADTPEGRLRYLPLPIDLPASPLRFDRLVAPVGADAPEWRDAR